MKKVIIGILPITKEDNVDPYKYKYSFINNYCKKVIECNAIPYGILLNDNEINEDILNLCDGFIIPGGKKLQKFHFNVIEHCLKYNKPLLGICLGMQVMSYYSFRKDYLIKHNKKVNIDNLWNVYEEFEDKNLLKLTDIQKPNIHGYEIMDELVECNMENLNKSKHEIYINKNSILYKIYKKDKINVYSMHLKQVKNIGSDLKISSYAEDNVIESLEYNDKNFFILGVQYHPELEKDNKLFNYFIKEVEMRKHV